MRNSKETVNRDNTELTRYVAGEHMDSDDPHLRRWGEIAGDYLGPAFHRAFRKGQVLYGSRRTYLKKVSVAPFDGICANTTFALESCDSDVLLPDLLPFVMLADNFTHHSIRESKGSVNPYINWKDIAKYEFPLPPKDEQRRIADILWAADEAAVHFHDALPQARLSQRVVFRDLSEREIHKSAGQVRTVGDAIIGIIAGKSPNGSSEPATETELGVLKVSAVGAFGFCPEENKKLLNPSEFDTELQVQPGFLLVTRANALRSGVGRACIVGETRKGLMLSDKTLRLVENHDRVRQRFLLEALRSRRCRKFIEGAANGTDAKNISQERLRQAPVWLPRLELQDSVVDVLKKGDETITQLEVHANRIRNLKRALRESLLSGEPSYVH